MDSFLEYIKNSLTLLRKWHNIIKTKNPWIGTSQKEISKWQKKKNCIKSDSEWIVFSEIKKQNYEISLIPTHIKNFKATIKKTNNTKYWQGYGTILILKDVKI